MRTTLMGAAAGLALGGTALHVTGKLPTREEAAAQLEAGGADVMPREELRAMTAPLALMTAGGIGAGYLRRGAANVSFGPALVFGAVALVASAGVSTMVNSSTNPNAYMAATGMAALAATVGYAAGVGARVPVRLAKGTGIALAVAGTALLAPSVMERVGSASSRVKAGFE